jgi:hypothetical protein
MDILSEFLQPLMGTLGEFVPGFVGALFVLIIGWLVAKMVSRAIRRLIAATGISERVSRDGEGLKIEVIVSRFVYYLILFFVLVFVLNSLGYGAVLDPVKSMYDSLLAAVPNIIAAGFIGLVGYMIARIVASLAEMAGEALERLMARGGVTGVDVSRVLHIFVFVMVFAPALLAAFEKLDIAVISVPATEMLNDVLTAVPKLLAAGVILLIAFIAGRIISRLVAQALVGVGADTLPERIGVPGMFETIPFSAVTGNVLFFFIMLTASVTAAERLDFAVLSQALNQVLVFAGSIIVGLVILGVGNWLANVAFTGLRNAGSTLAPFARFAILGLVLAMGLKAMGLADEIVNLAFGLTLGSLAVAFALAFGIGGRDAAAAQLANWMGRLTEQPPTDRNP